MIQTIRLQKKTIHFNCQSEESLEKQHTRIAKLVMGCEFRTCDECNNRLVLNTSNLVCVNCGLIHDQILVQDFSSFIIPTPPYSKSKSLERKHRLDYQTVEHYGLKNLYKKLFHIFSYLELTPNVRQRTLYLIKKNHKKHNIGYTYLACASLIEAIKEYKLLIPDTAIIATFKEFNMKIARRPTNTSRRELGFKARLTVTDFLKQFLSTLHKQNPELELRAKECLELAKLKRKFQGNSPRSFAAAIISIIYQDQRLNGDKKIKQVYLCKLFKIYYLTLRDNRNLILQNLNGGDKQ